MSAVFKKVKLLQYPFTEADIKYCHKYISGCNQIHFHILRWPVKSLMCLCKITAIIILNPGIVWLRLCRPDEKTASGCRTSEKPPNRSKGALRS